MIPDIADLTTPRQAICPHCFARQGSPIREATLRDGRPAAWFTCTDNHFVLDTPEEVLALLLTTAEHLTLVRLCASRGYQAPGKGGNPLREFLLELIRMSKELTAMAAEIQDKAPQLDGVGLILANAPGRKTDG